MTEWISVGLSIFAMIGSFIGFLLAQKEKREAKASEEQAKQHSENANSAYLEMKKYLGTLNKHADAQEKFKIEMEKVKKHLIEVYNEKSSDPLSNPSSFIYGIGNVYENLYKGTCDQYLLLQILKRLESDGMIREIIADGADKFFMFNINRNY